MRIGTAIFGPRGDMIEPAKKARLRRRGQHGRRAHLKACSRRGLYRAAELWVTDPLPDQRRRVRRRYGVDAARDNRELVRGSQIVLLAVKPQVLPQVLEEIRAMPQRAPALPLDRRRVPLRRLEDRPRRARPRRSGDAEHSGSSRQRDVGAGRRFARDDPAICGWSLRIFRGVGDAVAVADELLLDPVTGFSGSGPAYVYRFAEALIEAGRARGSPAEVVGRLVFRTLDGAAAMLLETGMTPKELREMVSSPGGTTLAGLAALDGGGFMER